MTPQQKLFGFVLFCLAVLFVAIGFIISRFEKKRQQRHDLDIADLDKPFYETE